MKEHGRDVASNRRLRPDGDKPVNAADGEGYRSSGALSRWTVAVGIGVALAGIGMQTCSAGTLADFFKQSTFDGTARAYYFTRDYRSTTSPNQDAFSLAGIFNVQTARFLGNFYSGASFFTAHSLGANNFDGNYVHLDSTLMGTHYSINALGQAYLAWQDSWAAVKVGDQIIKSPWLNPSDSRVLPATFQGLYADFKPADGFDVYALRVFRWKSRTSSSYYTDNLYYSSTWSGDSAYGGSTNLPGTPPATQGGAAGGTAYKADGARPSLWY